MIISNILQRVLLIKYKKSMGTSFTIEVDGKQYLITAKHVLNTLTREDEIEIFKDKKWQKLKVFPIFCKDNDVDIIALSFNLKNITPIMNIEVGGAGLTVGQDVYFLGFPYGFIADSYDLNNGYPFPFAKKGIVSAMDFSNFKLFIDAHNNRGFSGGPVFFVTSNKFDVHVCGVAHGFIEDNKETGENSGIGIVYQIKPIVDAVKEYIKK